MKKKTNIPPNPFSKEHLAHNFWSIFIPILCFSLGVLYNSWRGPSKVIVTNAAFEPDTIVLKMEGQVENNKAVEGKIVKLSNDVGNLKNFIALSSQINRLDQGINPILLVDTTHSKTDKNVNTKIPNFTKVEIAKVTQPQFKLPEIVKGYVKESFTQYAKFYTPLKSFKKDSKILFTVTFIDTLILSKISPIIVGVLRKDRENHYTQIFNQQYTIGTHDNLIVVPTNFSPGTYNLVTGFYKLDETNNDYPPFYSLETEINITE